MSALSMKNFMPLPILVVPNYVLSHYELPNRLLPNYVLPNVLPSNLGLRRAAMRLVAPGRYGLFRAPAARSMPPPADTAPR
jgi:hypothetical protein